MKIKKILLIVLILGLLVSGFFGISWLEKSAYEKGIKYGIEGTIVHIVQTGLQCQKISIPLGNQTMNLIPIECLNG